MIMPIIRSNISHTVDKYGHIIFYAQHCDSTTVVLEQAYSGYLASNDAMGYCGVIKRMIGTNKFSGWIAARDMHDYINPMPLITADNFLFELSGTIDQNNAIRGFASKIGANGKNLSNLTISGNIANGGLQIIINGLEDTIILNTPLSILLQKPKYQGG